MTSIDKSIPIPPARGRAVSFESPGTIARQPLGQLDIGDSFFIAAPEALDRQRARRLASNYKTWHPEWQYVTRNEIAPDGTKGIRIWRTA